MGEQRRRMDIEVSKRREREREDAGFRIFESYIRAIVRFDVGTDDPSVDISFFRDKFREFIKHAD